MADDEQHHPGLVPLYGSAARLALYRHDAGAAWQDVAIVSLHPGGLVLREVGRRFPGVWLATLDQVRVEGAGSFSPGTRRITRAPRETGQ